MTWYATYIPVLQLIVGICPLSPPVRVGECKRETLAEVFPLLEAVQPYVEGAHGRLMQCLAPSPPQNSAADVPLLKFAGQAWTVE